jgi:hypothetical protein
MIPSNISTPKGKGVGQAVREIFWFHLLILPFKGPPVTSGFISMDGHALCVFEISYTRHGLKENRILNEVEADARGALPISRGRVWRHHVGRDLPPRTDALSTSVNVESAQPACLCLQDRHSSAVCFHSAAGARFPSGSDPELTLN